MVFDSSSPVAGFNRYKSSPPSKYDERPAVNTSVPSSTSTLPWTGETGFVQHAWNKGMVDEAWGFKATPENTQIFLCGNPAMVEDMEKIISEGGFTEHTRKSPGTYHLERYW